jgi:hypothetical protein
MTHRVPNVRLMQTDRTDRCPNHDPNQETWVSLLIGRSLIVGIGGSLVALGLWTAWKIVSLMFG